MVHTSDSCSSRKDLSKSGPSNGEKEKKSNMKVVVRVRPPNCMEMSTQSSTSLRVMDERVLVFDPKEESVSYMSGDQRKFQPQLWKRRARDLRFMFDRVFDDKANNSDVFEHTTKAIIDGVLDGYNCTVFAYGATGAGKTFTMLGDPSHPGVMFLTMMDLYSRINACKDDKTCDVAVSYLEVYNETIRDLLMPGPALAVREDPQRGVCVSGLTLHKPTSAEELLGMLEFGNNNRTQHPTDANAQSSRSHAVFQVFVRQKDRTAGLKAKFTLGKMSLIDLAGSERAIVTSNRGARFREGANINKSLLALGNCINALADKENKAGHIPYRDSKLTRLLKDSLGGNCRTVMIAAVSPSNLSYEDTYNTLKYADRAMNIKCKIVKNELTVDLHVSRYAKIVEELRLEVSELKNKLFRYESGHVPATKPSASNSQTHSEIERLRSSMKSVMKERRTVQRDVIDIEAAERDLQVKLHRKERNLKRMQIMCVEGEKLEQAFAKTQSCLSATKSKQNYLSSKKGDCECKIAKNNEWMDRIQSEMKLVEGDQEAANQLQLCRAAAQSEMDNMELKRQCQLYKRHIRLEEKDVQNTERLVVKLLGMVRKQFFLLKGVGLATQDLTDEYEGIIDTLERGREVSWADQSPKQNSQTNKSALITFQAINVGTPSRTPIRTRQFNTPVIGNINMTPCRTGSISKQLRKAPLTTPRDKDLLSTDNVDFPNACISLTKEFEALSSPVNMSNRKATPHPKVCWTDTPGSSECRTPQPTHDRLSDSGPEEVNVSGILALKETLQVNNQQKTPLRQVSCTRPQDILSTPLRELSVNKQTAPRDQLPSVLKQSYTLGKDKVKRQTTGGFPKNNTEMIPKRVCNSAKENNQRLHKPSRYGSVTELRTINFQKVKKHVGGLRRAVSSTNISSGRQFAAHSIQEENHSVQHRPRWQ